MVSHHLKAKSYLETWNHISHCYNRDVFILLPIFRFGDDVSQWSSRGPEILTTSSRAALRPKVQVSRVRQLMKEVKSSLGRAIKVLRGNMVMRLEMMLEMPTASESSISILATKNKGRGRA